MSTTKTHPLLDLETLANEMDMFAQVLGHMVESPNQIRAEIFAWLSWQVSGYANRVQAGFDALHAEEAKSRKAALEAQGRP